MTDETVEEVARRKRAERLALQQGAAPVRPAGDDEDIKQADAEDAGVGESHSPPVELSELDKRSEEARSGDKPAHIREGGKGGFGN